MYSQYNSNYEKNKKRIPEAKTRVKEVAVSKEIFNAFVFIIIII
jgi:hypothetical protein